MKTKLYSILIASSLGITSLGIEAAGFRQIQVSDPGYKDLNVGLWYPSDQPAADKPNTEFELAVALDAPVSSPNGGLVVISHGYGGWYGGHADTAVALADAGFVVAAPSHTGNTWSDMSSSIDQWALDRPRHTSRIIDHILEQADFRESIKLDKIGVYGFSAGGYTALSLIGGVPDLDHAEQHCMAHPDEFVCTEGMITVMQDANMHELPSSAWGADPRIKAAAIAAPGLGFTYTKASLANVTADVQLWSGELDHSVPTQTNAASLALRLSRKAETYWIDKANHFAFMLVACRDAFKQEDPMEYEMVCTDAAGFDRSVFHVDMHREMVRFFKQSFAIDG